ncbi:MAG: hypothetical protein AB7D38_12010 [Sulfurimonas sp.]|uniref:hypothetical protein n=1 Tax=Sulfurimonas sp. TaxID=2022749 RepID=UPI003D147A68
MLRTKWREKFSGISTKRLEKWLLNVEFIKKEYEDGTHDASNCRHCSESSGSSIDRVCHKCIWYTMTGVKCIDYVTWVDYITRTYKNYNSFNSTDITHKKAKHIVRCDTWIALIQKELDRRNKKCS